jgi:hypothetical protein
MDIKKEASVWLEELKLSEKSLRGPYIKKSNQSDLTYKSSYGHGTCTILVEDAEVCRLVLSYLIYTSKEF